MSIEKKKIVVKVGTSTLTHKTGKTNIARMSSLVQVLADLHNICYNLTKLVIISIYQYCI